MRKQVKASLWFNPVCVKKCFSGTRTYLGFSISFTVLCSTFLDTYCHTETELLMTEDSTRSNMSLSWSEQWHIYYKALLNASLLRYYITGKEQSIVCDTTYSPTFPPPALLKKKGNCKLYRRLNNTLAVYVTTTQSKRSHSTKHLLSLSWWRGGNSAQAVPFQLISDKGKVLHNHQASGCKTAVSEVQAQDANHICLTVSLNSLTVSVSVFTSPDLSLANNSGVCVFLLLSLI